MSPNSLTIATVTRNCANTIDATLASVGPIKPEGVEYVVIDGASTDGTLERLRAAGDLIDALVSEPDSGIYNAMNKAVARASGRYIAFINGDDQLLADGVSMVLERLATEHAPIVAAVTLVGSVDAPSEVLRPQPWKLPFFNSIPHPSSFVSTELLKRVPFREDLRIAADYDFFLRCYLDGFRFSVLDVPTALHHRGGASGNQQLSDAEVRAIRRMRLGWRLPVAETALWAYRAARQAMRSVHGQ